MAVKTNQLAAQTWTDEPEREGESGRERKGTTMTTEMWKEKVEEHMKSEEDRCIGNNGGTDRK